MLFNKTHELDQKLASLKTELTKLSEDLDVLDALRLSVQHCEEVMKENEDRYPILENTYNILTKQVEEPDLPDENDDIDE